MQIIRCDLTLQENTFFSSREVGNYYQTEPFIGNYALCYALGLVAAPYHNDGTIFYGEHLAGLNEQGVYVTPATLIGQPRFAVEQFNAQPDSYWYAMGNNALITKPDGWDAVQRGNAWYLVHRTTGARKKARTMNRPQIGRIKMLGIGNQARFYVLAQNEIPDPPRYVRLGKWMSKARIDAKRVDFATAEADGVESAGLLNPLDLPSAVEVHTFDLLSVHPVPLMRNAVLSGPLYQLSDGAWLPRDMRFGVEVLIEHDSHPSD